MAGYLRNLLGTYSITNMAGTKNIIQVDDAGNQTLTGMLYESAASGLIAGTTRTQAGGLQLTAEVNRIDTSTAPAAGSLLGDGVVLPVAVAGLDLTVINNTLNPIQVYGNGSDSINGIAGSVGVAIPPKSTEMFECAAAGAWHFDGGVGFSGQLNTVLSLDGIQAAGTNQATATQLVADINRVSGGTGGVILPASFTGMDVFVINHSGAPFQVYANGSDTIMDLPGATGVQQMNNSDVLFTCAATGAWYTNGIGTGYAGQYPTSSYADALTASATQTQAAGTPLSAVINRFSTVATAGNAATLMSAQPGMSITVINSTANAINVFPAVGQTINTLAANAAYSVPGNTVIVFFCTAAGSFWTK